MLNVFDEEQFKSQLIDYFSFNEHDEDMVMDFLELDNEYDITGEIYEFLKEAREAGFVLAFEINE